MVFESCEWTDKHIHTHRDKLITILCNPMGRSNNSTLELVFYGAGMSQEEKIVKF